MEINANDYKNTSKTINASKVQENKTLQMPLTIVDVTEEKLNDKKKIALKFGGIQDEVLKTSLKPHPDIAVKFYPSSFFQGTVGTNSKNIEQAFDEARKTPCKIFVMLMDEIDGAMMRKKGMLNVQERTNAFIAELQGMKDSSMLLVIGTTNHRLSIEPAALDRFTEIEIPLPTKEDRIKMVEKFLLPLPFEFTIIPSVVAERSDGFTGRNFMQMGAELMELSCLYNRPITAIDLNNIFNKYVSIASRRKNDEHNKE